MSKSNHLFNFNHIEFSEEPLFLGKGGRNIARLDLNIEQGIQKMTNDALGRMWFATDFSYIEDAKDYQSMQTLLQLLFLKNLKFQTTADSAAARSVAEVFIPITTNPQLESWWYQHAFYENNIHSQTYAEIIKALPVNAKEIFDTIMLDENIIKRFKDILAIFEQTVVLNSRMILSNTGEDVGYNEEEHQKSIIMSLYALNILEAMLFKSSFLTSFAYKENGLMSSTGDAIKKIQLDEIGHYATTTNIINRLKKDPEWIHLFAFLEPQVYELYQKAIDADYAWIDHLFEEGVILLGISNDALKQFVDYNAKIVMTSVGLKPLKEDVFNSCSWANKYSKSSNVQTAMKEKNSANYLLGQLNTTFDSDFWDKLKLE